MVDGKHRFKFTSNSVCCANIILKTESAEQSIRPSYGILIDIF